MPVQRKNGFTDRCYQGFEFPRQYCLENIYIKRCRYRSFYSPRYQFRNILVIYGRSTEDKTIHFQAYFSIPYHTYVQLFLLSTAAVVLLNISGLGPLVAFVLCFVSSLFLRYFVPGMNMEGDVINKVL